MALKDKLMTLEDFKAVRDVDVASNNKQFTDIKADLDDKAVRFDIAQERTDAEKAQARKNIGANDNETIWDMQDRLEELENSLKDAEYLSVDFGYVLIDLLKHVPYMDSDGKKYYDFLKLTM